MTHLFMSYRWFDGQVDFLDGSDHRLAKLRLGYSGTDVVEATYYGFPVTSHPDTTLEPISAYRQASHDLFEKV